MWNQDPGQALTIGSPLLSYLDIRLHGFLPPGLTVGEAWRLDPRQIRARSLLPVRVSLADTVFHSRIEHSLVEEPYKEARATEQAEVESVGSSEETDTEDPKDEMVVRRNIRADQFLFGGPPPIK